MKQLHCEGLAKLPSVSKLEPPYNCDVPLGFLSKNQPIRGSPKKPKRGRGVSLLKPTKRGGSLKKAGEGVDYCHPPKDCLRRCPYSATLLASRDTELCRVSPTLLQLIAMDFPQAETAL